VDIPIPDLLLRLREKGKREHSAAAAAGTPPMGAWSLLASQPTAWKAALLGGKIINYLPTKMLPIPALRAWEGKRTLPEWKGGEFRKWLKQRNARTPGR
jgi:L-lactate dehydrogenase complex protein LldF